MASASPPVGPQEAPEASVLPTVARSRAGIPTWAVVSGIAVLGLLLFLVLDARRQSLTAPPVRPRSVDAISTLSAAPPLYIPPEPAPPPSPTPAPAPAVLQPPVRPEAPPPATPAQTVQVYVPQPSTAPAAPATAPQRSAAGPALIIDTTGPGPSDEGATERPAERQAAATGSSPIAVAGTRTSAGMLANRSTTVAQGTLIPAVLETALDSTRPGLARAIVSRDIRSFDGDHVLIPRGSRLIGEYGSQTETGQNRMLVNWIRLIRPDGATIAIGSPASDPVGRGGIRADVNSHFFERFAGAILQSALDVGVGLAARSADSSYVVALPGSFGGAMPRAAPTQIRPTLKVKAASSVSVFVARDLDFTGVENR